MGSDNEHLMGPHRVPLAALVGWVRGDVVQCDACQVMLSVESGGATTVILCGWHESLTAGARLVGELYDGNGQS